MVPLAMTIRFLACHSNSKHFRENVLIRDEEKTYCFGLFEHSYPKSRLVVFCSEDSSHSAFPM